MSHTRLFGSVCLNRTASAALQLVCLAALFAAAAGPSSSGAQTRPVRDLTLFIDANNAPLEIERVERSVPVVVIPSFETFSVEHRLQIEKTVQRLSSERARYHREKTACHNNRAADDPCREQYNVDRFRELARRHTSEFEQAKGPYDLDEFFGEMRELVRSGQSRSVVSIVISGHQAHGDVFGELLPKKGLEELQVFFKEHTASFPRVRNLVLLACNAGTPEAIQRWGNLLPTIRLVIGADGKAPIKTDERNLRFIEVMSDHLKTFGQAGLPLDVDEQRSIHRALTLPGWNSLATLWRTQTADHYFNGRGFQKLDRAK